MKEKRKLAFVVDDITTHGGIERVVIQLSGLFPKEHFHLSIISIYHANDSIQFLSKSDINFFYLNLIKEDFTVRRFKRIKYDYKHLFKPLKVFLKEHLFDIIVGTNYRINICLGLLNFFNKTITIGTEHLEYYATRKSNRFFRLLLYRSLNALVVLSNRDAFIYKKYLKRVVVIENPLSFLPEVGSGLTNKQILSVGRCTDQKGFDLLLKAYKKVYEKHIDWRLVIVGEGEKKEALISLVIELGISNNIVFMPPTNKIADIYLESTIYVLSSRYEGFPMVLIEAMVSGLAVVSFKCPTGPEEIIHNNIDGILVDCFDVEELACTINLLIDDIELRNRIAKNARANILRYSEDRILEKWLNLFESLTVKTIQ